MPRTVVALTTLGSVPAAEKLARHLVQKRLAACVNILPAVSFYTWKKRLCRERESLLVMKTTTARVASLEKELHRRHPYELPEFVVLPIVKGSRRYLNWLAGQVRGSR